jgi:hypothetical protein
MRACIWPGYSGWRGKYCGLSANGKLMGRLGHDSRKTYWKITAIYYLLKSQRIRDRKTDIRMLVAKGK